MYVSQHLLTPCRLRLASLEQVSSSFTTFTREPTITKHNPMTQVTAFSCLYLLKCLLHIFNQLVTAVFVCFWIVCFIICSPVISIVRIACKARMHHIRTPHTTLLRSAGAMQLLADHMQTCSFSPKAKWQSTRCSGFSGEESAPPRLCPMNA